MKNYFILFLFFLIIPIQSMLPRFTKFKSALNTYRSVPIRKYGSISEKATFTLFSTLGLPKYNDEYYQIMKKVEKHEPSIEKQVTSLELPNSMEEVGAINRKALGQHKLFAWDIIYTMQYREKFPINALKNYFDALLLYQNYTNLSWQQLKERYYKSNFYFPIPDNAVQYDSRCRLDQAMARRVAYCCEKLNMQFNPENIYLFNEQTGFGYPKLLVLDPRYNLSDSLYLIGCLLSLIKLSYMSQKITMWLACDLKLLEKQPFKFYREILSRAELQAAECFNNAYEGAQFLSGNEKPLPVESMDELIVFLKDYPIISDENFKTLLNLPVAKSNVYFSTLFYKTMLLKPKLLKDPFINLLETLHTAMNNDPNNLAYSYPCFKRFLDLLTLAQQQKNNGKPTAKEDFADWLSQK